MCMTESEFSCKYKLYSQELFNICYGYTRSVSSSEDILQEVFLKYLNCNQNFKDISLEKYWLIRVTINTCKNYVKSLYHKKVTLNQEILEAYPDQSLKKETDVLTRIVKHLPQKYKEIIILYYYNSYQTKDIANVLKLSLSAVKKRLERARNMIQEEMEKYL